MGRAADKPGGSTEGSSEETVRESGNMASRRGRQKGAQRQAEGKHGEKTHRRLQEELQSGRREPDPAEERGRHDKPGKHRLFEGRQQHGEP
jgi:hypothetical protein